MKHLKIFKEHAFDIHGDVPRSTYTEVEETNGNEGETWVTYVREKGNEDFISKLKSTCEKFQEHEEGDCYIIVVEEGVDQSEVDLMVRKTKSGYYDYYNKHDGKIDPSVIDDSSEDNFVESFYKRKYFN